MHLIVNGAFAAVEDDPHNLSKLPRVFGDDTVGAGHSFDFQKKRER
jgi:hypothetical protein